MQLKLRNFFPISLILFVSILSSYQKLSVVPEYPHHFIFFLLSSPGAIIRALDFRTEDERADLSNWAENLLYAGSIRKLLLKLLIWKEPNFCSAMPVYSINAQTSRQVSSVRLMCSEIAFPCKQNSWFKTKLLHKIGLSQTTTFLDSAKKQQASLIRKGESKVSRSITGRFRSFYAFSCDSAHRF